MASSRVVTLLGMFTLLAVTATALDEANATNATTTTSTTTSTTTATAAATTLFKRTTTKLAPAAIITGSLTLTVADPGAFAKSPVAAAGVAAGLANVAGIPPSDMAVKLVVGPAGSVLVTYTISIPANTVDGDMVLRSLQGTSTAELADFITASVGLPGLTVTRADAPSLVSAGLSGAGRCSAAGALLAAAAAISLPA